MDASVRAQEVLIKGRGTAWRCGPTTTTAAAVRPVCQPFPKPLATAMVATGAATTPLVYPIARMPPAKVRLAANLAGDSA